MSRHRVPASRIWFNHVDMSPDWECSGMWVYSEDGPEPWSAEDDEHPVVSASLAHRVEEWVGSWTEHCYFRGCVWDDREIFNSWCEQATLLCALANRELVPQGFAVVWTTPRFPDEHGAPLRSERMIKRRFRRNLRDLTPREFTRVINEANAVLDRYSQPPIPRLVEPAPVVKNRRLHAR